MKLSACKYNTVLRDKKFVDRHPDEIKVGDIVQLMPGSTVPADGIIIKGHEIIIDESLYSSLLPDTEMNRCYKAATSQSIIEMRKIIQRYSIDVESLVLNYTTQKCSNVESSSLDHI